MAPFSYVEEKKERIASLLSAHVTALTVVSSEATAAAAPATAFRKACLLYAANGMKWEKSIEGFCRWSLFYDLYLKMTLWGDQIRHADDEISLSTRGPQNLMELLPAEFTIEDAQRVRQQRGLDASQRATAHMIRTWRNRGYCAQRTEHSFKKV